MIILTKNSDKSVDAMTSFEFVISCYWKVIDIGIVSYAFSQNKCFLEVSFNEYFNFNKQKLSCPFGIAVQSWIT